MSDETQSAQSTRQYLYGDKPTWQIVLDAVQSFASPVSAADVRKHIVAILPSFAPANVSADLYTLTVNSAARGNYRGNKEPRRTDSGNENDRLFKIGRGRDARFVSYDPQFHGVWELKDVGDKVLRVRQIESYDSKELECARESVAARGQFDPSEDARKRMLATIVQREGQPAFRADLLDAYDRRCVISGCAVEALLEAAHIVPYRGAHTNVIGNGLLLRADLHKLFDLHLISIDPATLTIQLHHSLLKSEYACFDGVRLRDPGTTDQAPLNKALEDHRARCGWLNARADGAPLDEGEEVVLDSL